jgi:Toprim-like
MITITTRQGKDVEIVLESELCSPMDMGERVRAYCHIHGSDHQRSLSINKATGWGHCFNAACGATVLVAEWNRTLAKRLLHSHYQGLTSAALPDYTPPSEGSRYRQYAFQPMLLPPPRSIPQWQQHELHALRELDGQMRCALVYTRRARMYLSERGIPLKVALATGVGYLPSALLNGQEMRKQRGLLRRWADRIIFPLNSPDGRGYIGRSLWHWQPGMNETTHKALLDRSGSPRRWIKTCPAGWFSADSEDVPRTIILVEGAFDRLTLLAAGFSANDIIALVGTAAPVDWLPAPVKTIVLALDGDEGGQEASNRLADQLALAGLQVKLCPLSQDGCGKDWNERWQRMGRKSVASVFEAFYEAISA